MYYSKGKNKNLTKEQLLARIMKYCAYQERCVQEVEKKLNDLGCEESLQEELIEYLKEEKFLDEERFVKFYTSGKFRYNQWGKIKIRLGLRAKGIEEELIEKYIGQINPEEYTSVVKKLIQKKKGSLSEEDPFKAKAKVLNYVLGKGFEYEDVKSYLD